MSDLTLWGRTELVAAAQLVAIAALGLHLLVARPLLARRRLRLQLWRLHLELLGAVQDGVDPAPVQADEVVRHHLRRLIDDPGSVRVVRWQLQQELAAREEGHRGGTDLAYLRLQALTAVCEQYLRTGWPWTGRLISTGSLRAAKHAGTGPQPTADDSAAMPTVSAAPEVLLLDVDTPAAAPDLVSLLPRQGEPIGNTQPVPLTRRHLRAAEREPH